jgi:hypothetical protein
LWCFTDFNNRSFVKIYPCDSSLCTDMCWAYSIFVKSFLLLCHTICNSHKVIIPNYITKRLSSQAHFYMLILLLPKADSLCTIKGLAGKLRCINWSNDKVVQVQCYFWSHLSSIDVLSEGMNEWLIVATICKRYTYIMCTIIGDDREWWRIITC